MKKLTPEQRKFSEEYRTIYRTIDEFLWRTELDQCVSNYMAGQMAIEIEKALNANTAEEEPCPECFNAGWKPNGDSCPDCGGEEEPRHIMRWAKTRNPARCSA